APDPEGATLHLHDGAPSARGRGHPVRARAHPERELAARAPALPDRALSPAGARGRRPARGLAHPDPAGALRQRRRRAGRAARARGSGLLGGGDPAADRAPGELAPARDAVRRAHGGGSRRARRAPRALLLCPRAERSRVSALYCEVSGRGGDLVLLRGGGLNRRVWDGLAGALTARFRVIAIDLPGHGRSDWDASAGTPAAQAWRVHETLAPLTRRYALLGWSLGGQLALDLAAALPSGIERLALIATTPRFLTGPEWRCGTAPALLARLERQLREDSGRTVREFLKLQVRGVASRKCSRSSCVAEGGEAFRLDRAQLRASFDRASASYESASELQTRVATELLERLAAFDFLPAVVLDLGAGTGRLTRELKRRYRRALVIALDLSAGMLREARRHQRPWRRFERVCGDALRLPLADASVDVVFSSLMLQWR